MISSAKEDSLVVLQLLQTKGIGPKSVLRILKALPLRKMTLSDVVSLEPAAIAAEFKIKPELAERIPGSRESAERLWDVLQREPVNVLMASTSGYPARLEAILKDSAPPVIFARGNAGLLNVPSVGFCGSRHASAKGIKVAQTCAELLAQRGFNVVSGYAHGVDLAAHASALAAGGTTTFVLAEGILRFKRKAEIADLFDLDKVLLLSEFLPELPWEAHNAMQRNSTICALSNAMVLVESGLSGGTFAAGEQSFRLGIPLFVVEYAELPISAEGNPHFVNKGAISLRNSRASLDALLQTLQDGQPVRVAEQLNLWSGSSS